LILDHRTAVILVNIGTPDEPTEAAIRRYLKEFLSDPRVITGPRLVWWFVLRLLILPNRPKELRLSYKAIWGKDSPIRMVSAELINRLKQEYNNGVIVEAAMTYGKPGISTVVGRLLKEQVERLLVVPLFPQYSDTTTAAAMDRVSAALVGCQHSAELRYVRSYHDHPIYIRAVAESISREWESNGRSERLLISFHGLPIVKNSKDPYLAQCQQSAELIASELRLESHEWTITFQSRRGSQPWLQPYTDETLRQIAGEGVKSVTVVCPGFAADCLETLQEIDVEARQTFLSSGGKSFQYIPALNAGEKQVELLDALVNTLVD